MVMSSRKTHDTVGPFNNPLQVGPDGTQAPLSYRYKVTPNPQINAFKPKKLDDDASMGNLKASVLGAVFHKKFSQLPVNESCKVVWEAGACAKNHQKSLYIVLYMVLKIHLVFLGLFIYVCIPFHQIGFQRFMMFYQLHLFLRISVKYVFLCMCMLIYACHKLSSSCIYLSIPDVYVHIHIYIYPRKDVYVSVYAFATVLVVPNLGLN